jgi:hypothetical protein
MFNGLDKSFADSNGARDVYFIDDVLDILAGCPPSLTSYRGR